MDWFRFAPKPYRKRTSAFYPINNFRLYLITPSELWKRADESLKIIEDSLIAQGDTVESLSISLPELYQKSQELQGSMNALSQRFGSFEEYLSSLDRNMAQAILVVKASKAELMTWKIHAIASVCATITIALRETIRGF